MALHFSIFTICWFVLSLILVLVLYCVICEVKKIRIINSAKYLDSLMVAKNNANFALLKDDNKKCIDNVLNAIDRSIDEVKGGME